MEAAKVDVSVNQVKTLERVTSQLRPELTRVNQGKRGQEWTLKAVVTAHAKA